MKRDWSCFFNSSDFQDALLNVLQVGGGGSEFAEVANELIREALKEEVAGYSNEGRMWFVNRSSWGPDIEVQPTKKCRIVCVEEIEEGD